MARSRVELFEQIRRDERAGGLSIRELAAKHHVHRRTVRQALASPVPPPRKVYPPRPRPAVGAYAQVIDGWLVADQGVPRKQRHTARLRPRRRRLAGRVTGCRQQPGCLRRVQSLARDQRVARCEEIHRFDRCSLAYQARPDMASPSIARRS